MTNKRTFLLLFVLLHSCSWAEYANDSDWEGGEEVSSQEDEEGSKNEDRRKESGVRSQNEEKRKEEIREEIKEEEVQPHSTDSPWVKVIGEIITDPIELKEDGNILYLTVKNQNPIEELNFATLLREVGKDLVNKKAHYKIIIAQASGPAGTIYKSRFYLEDIKSFLKKQFSEPELQRRMEIRKVETVESLQAKARLLRQEKINNEALIVLKKWLELDSMNLEALSLMGNVLRDERKYWDAIGSYEKILEIDPKNLFAHHNSGFCYGKVGAYQDAIDAYKSALAIHPNDETLLVQLAQMYQKNGDTNGALVTLNKVRAMHDSPDLYLIEGNVYRDAHQYDKARLTYKKGFTQDPADYRFLFNQILNDLDQKKFDDAKKKFSELKEKDPRLTEGLAQVEIFNEI